MSNTWQLLVDHLTLAVSGTLALLVMAGVVTIWERIGLPEWSQIVRWLWPGHGRGTAVEASVPVNVETLDRSGELLDPGPFVGMTIHNTTGRLYTAVGGIFLECNSAWIRPGTLVHLNIQNGKVREDLVVTYDLGRKTLFIQSAFTTAEILAKIHKAPGPVVQPAAQL